MICSLCHTSIDVGDKHPEGYCAGDPPKMHYSPLFVQDGKEFFINQPERELTELELLDKALEDASKS